MKPEPLLYGDRRVYTVSSFNDGVASWVARLPTLWVEGELTDLRRQDAWQNVFFTLKDIEDGSTVSATMPRRSFDSLGLESPDGARVQVYGRAELWPARGEFRLRVLTIEPVGAGALLVRLEQLRKQLAGEGLFAPERKRPLPGFPERIGLVTGSEAAAKQDVITAIRARFPPARILVAETYVQGPRAPVALVDTIAAICAAGVDVVILARGGGSFEDLLAFSDERLVRAVANCPVPIVSAVGHEQDTPLCDLAADARASTPTAAARLVVPDWQELLDRLGRIHERVGAAGERRIVDAREALERDRLRLVHAPVLLLERKRAVVTAAAERLRRAPAALVDKRRTQIDGLAGKLRTLAPVATLARGYAIVRREGAIVRSAQAVTADDLLEIELAAGRIGARVEDVRP